MEINQIVADQIKQVYANTSRKEKESIGVQINETSRIQLLKNNSITLNFQQPKGLDAEYVATFFKGRLPEDEVSIYYRKNSISIYTSYRPKAKGIEIFKRAMDIYKNFRNLHDQYIVFMKLVELQ